MSKIKIGLIGEAPNDTDSVKHLLSKKYTDVEFISLLKRVNGSQLDNQKTKSFLRKEYEWNKPDCVLFIRDLDGLESEVEKIRKRKEYFKEFNSVVDGKGVFLLHIFEIEALIFTDLSVLNEKYGCELRDYSSDPMLIVEPKEVLKKMTKNKFKEVHNSEIFKEIDFDKVLSCRYFSDFIKEFSERIGIE